MHTLHSNGKTLLLVEVYKDVSLFKIQLGHLYCKITPYARYTNWILICWVGDKCKLIGLLRELKPEQVRPYISKHGKLFLDYITGDLIGSEAYSFSSLLLSKGINLSLNWLLIEKVN